MGNGSTGSDSRVGVRSAVKWVWWTLGLTVVIAVALVCVPWLIVWCLLFDTD